MFCTMHTACANEPWIVIAGLTPNCCKVSHCWKENITKICKKMILQWFNMCANVLQYILFLTICFALCTVLVQKYLAPNCHPLVSHLTPWEEARMPLSLMIRTMKMRACQLDMNSSDRSCLTVPCFICVILLTLLTAYHTICYIASENWNITSEEITIICPLILPQCMCMWR